MILEIYHKYSIVLQGIKHETLTPLKTMNTAPKPVRIGDKLVGPGHPPYIIAEIGINHNGYVTVARDLIDIAVKAGCDAVKFQKRTVEVVYQGELDKPREVPRDILEHAIARGVLSPQAVDRLGKSDLKGSTNGDQKYALEFTAAEYAEIDAYCRERGIAWFASPWDVDSVSFLEKFDPPCHKIASACNEDDALLRRLKETGRPLILSTGMTDLDGIKAAIAALGGTENLVILHCTSVYPKGTGYGARVFESMNLRGIGTLEKEFGVPVGFSSHDAGIMPSYAAAARGACVIEVHVTANRSMYGSDQGSSLEPQELQRLCQALRELPIALGDGNILVYPAEREVENKLRRVRRNNNC